MNRYRHLFFDLDRTLWDYEKNVRETMLDIYLKYNIASSGKNNEEFFDLFYHFNERLWFEYGIGKIKKEVLRDMRFELTLKELGIRDAGMVKDMSDDYITISPSKTNLLEGTVETLDYLRDKKYHMHIITNGFNEVQFKKLKNCKLDSYFEKVTTSDSAGSQKPSKKIFHSALSSANARKEESIMIGDSWELDILGAKDYGIDQVYLNHKGLVNELKPTYEITNISGLISIL